MVEAAALGLDNSVLLDNLSYKLGHGAAYVQERKSVTFYASGSNSYSPRGTKLIKLVLTGDGWLDPSTFRVMFTVNNTATGAAQLLRPLSDAHSFFSRVRILMGSTVVEDINDYARLHEMFNLLINKNSKANLSAEGFGLPARDYKTTFDVGVAANQSALTLTNFPGLKGQDSQAIMFTPLSGIFAQSKYIPLRYSPIIIELELCKEFDDPFVSNLIAPFTTTNTSNNWDLSNVQAKCDLLTLDSDLENGYTQLLMSGKHLTLSYSTYIHQYQSIAGNKTRLNIARSLSRLKSVFVTFDNKNLNGNAVHRTFNSFYSPMFDDGDVPIFGADKEMEFSISLGSKMYPEQPIRSHQEAYYQLRKTLGIQSSALHSFDISAQEYKRRSFVLGIDTETILHAAFSGHNTRSGELLNIQFDHNVVADIQPTDMYVVLHSDNLVEISDSGVRCYD